jgi:hypothetical protein
MILDIILDIALGRVIFLGSEFLVLSPEEKQ